MIYLSEHININEIIDEYAKSPFEIQGVYSVAKSAGLTQRGHTSFSAFIFPVKGDARLNFDGSPVGFSPGKIIHGCPGKLLTAQSATENPAEFYMLCYLYNGANHGYMNSLYELDAGVSPRLFSILSQLLTSWEKPVVRNPLEVKARAYSVLAEMFSSAQVMEKVNANHIIEDAKAYIEQNYMEPHSLFELGKRYGMGGKYFSDVFRRYTGVSPINYLINYRMEQARKLLLQTDCSVREIGITIGYEDAKLFSRLFKKHAGLAPCQWREHSSRKV